MPLKLLLGLFILLGTQALCAQEPHPLSTYEGLSQAIASKTRLRVLDLRDYSDFKKGHIPGAMTAQVNGLLREPPTSDLTMPLILVDRFGNLVDRAYTILRSMGYTNVIIFGPMVKWKGEKISNK